MLQLFKYVVTSFLLIAIIVSVNCTILSLKAALREVRRCTSLLATALTMLSAGALDTSPPPPVCQDGSVSVRTAWCVRACTLPCWLCREYRILFIMYLLVPTIVVSLNFLVMTWYGARRCHATSRSVLTPAVLGRRQEWAFRLTLSCLLLVLEAYLLFQFRPSRVNPVFIRMQLLAQAPPPPAQPEQPPPQEQEQVN